MPNWTFNQITTDNPKIIPMFINEEGKFDFNKLIAMPKSLNLEDGSMTHEAIAYYITERLTIPCAETNLNTLITNHFDANWAETVVNRLEERDLNKGLYTGDELYELGKQYMFNYENYGHFTWYGWCNENWNTKWNACDTLYSEKDPVRVSFDTAWDAPIPIFEKICAMFPDSEILFDCEFEDGYYVEYTNTDGELEKIYECHCDNDDE